MYVLNSNPPRYKEYFIYLIVFAFGKCVTIIDWLSNMKLYVYNILESYRDTIIDNMGNSDIENFLLHMVQCWCACAVVEYNRDLPMVLHCSGIMY